MLCPHPGPKVQATAALAALGELRYSGVSIVSRGFKAKGPIAPFLGAANSGSQSEC